MSKEEHEDNEDEDDWMKYANAGFGQTDYSLWDETEQPPTEDEDDSSLDQPQQLGTHMEEIPRAPSPAGHKHLVRIGTCDHCLGRLGGKKTFNQSIEQSGAEIRATVIERDAHLSTAREEEPLCPFCENLYEEAELLSDIIFDALEPYELSRLQLGARIPKDQIEEEEEMRKRFGAGGSDALKSGLVSTIAQHLNKRLEGVKLVNDKPQILALIDVLTLTVELDIRAHYLYGRYLKLERGIPQTRWPCRACRGRAQGCDSCEETGLQYIDSVQDLIGEPIREALGAEDTSFHGMGREDIDVRCLGSGRPFVLEVKKPSKRQLPVEDLVDLVMENALEKVEVDSLTWCTRKKVNEVKQSRSEKTYTIRFRAEGLVDIEDAEKSILSLDGQVIDQETPQRVSHRRAAKIRRRKITSIENVRFEGDEIEITMRCEAGTYIKELVHSDEGRTTPSVQSVLGTDCEVIWLDVLEIHSE